MSSTADQDAAAADAETGTADAEPETADAAGDAAADEEFTDVAGLSYEQARDELVDIVARLEGGHSGLEESMALWRRGEALAAHCGTWLDGAEALLGKEQPQA